MQVRTDWEWLGGQGAKTASGELSAGGSSHLPAIDRQQNTIPERVAPARTTTWLPRLVEMAIQIKATDLEAFRQHSRDLSLPGEGWSCVFQAALGTARGWRIGIPPGSRRRATAWSPIL